jgi:hypothetical protein
MTKKEEEIERTRKQLDGRRVGLPSRRVTRKIQDVASFGAKDKWTAKSFLLRLFCQGLADLL